MSKAKTKEYEALLEKVSEMFDEAGCVLGIDGEEVLAEKFVPEAKKYISETIDDPEALYDPEIWNRPGFTLVLSWLAQKWHQKCQKLAPRVSKNPEQYLTKEQQKTCLDSAAVELIREIAQRRPLN
jgi:hypothetical protein